jgi:hypothetical protein
MLESAAPSTLFLWRIELGFERNNTWKSQFSRWRQAQNWRIVLFISVVETRVPLQEKGPY